MNAQRFWLTAFVVLVALALSDVVIHGVLLAGTYREVAFPLRASMNVPVLILGYAVLAPLFTWIYAEGYGGGAPAAEGLRFGLALGVFFWTGSAMMRYAVEPLPGRVALYWFVIGTVQLGAVGAVAGLVYGRGGTEPPPAAEAEVERRKAA